MKKLVVRPSGFPCYLKDCPPGLFTYYETLGVKTEYTAQDGDIEVYVADSGEVFWGGVDNFAWRDDLTVMPCELEWVDE